LEVIFLQEGETLGSGEVEVLEWVLKRDVLDGVRASAVGFIGIKADHELGWGETGEVVINGLDFEYAGTEAHCGAGEHSKALDIIMEGFAGTEPDKFEGRIEFFKDVLDMLEALVHFLVLVAGIGKDGDSFASEEQAEGRAFDSTAKGDKGFHFSKSWIG